MAGNIVYSKKHYKVIAIGSEYIVYNSKEKIDKRTLRGKTYYKNYKKKKGGMDYLHTHINNYKTAIMLIDCCLKEKLPKHASPSSLEYFCTSILRIMDKDQKDFYNKVEQYKELKKTKKKQVYYNVN